jgi:hypothetical protein
MVLLIGACEVSCRARAEEVALRNMAIRPKNMVPPLLASGFGVYDDAS